jgi:hypothetical protein
MRSGSTSKATTQLGDALRVHVESGYAIRDRATADVPPVRAEVALAVDQDTFAAAVEPGF